MKTISGKVLTSKPISLSRAARYLSKFTASDNEASASYAAYLRRTLVSFTELVQLHKDLNISTKVEIEKDRASGMITDGTVNSVNIPQEDGFATVGRKSNNSKREKHDEGDMDEGVQNNDEDTENIRDEVEERFDARSSEMEAGLEISKGVIDGSVADEGAVAKKSKKKRERDRNVEVTQKDQPDDRDDANNVSEVKNEMGVFGGGEETKKKKNKKKTDRHETEGSDVAVRTEEEVQIDPHRQNEGNEEESPIVQDGGQEQKKHQKKSKRKHKVKDEMESSPITSAEQRHVRNGQNVPETVDVKVEETGGEKKRKKKQIHEAQEQENEEPMESEAANKKESRKRKHERVTDGGLEGSQEVHKSKKKKR